MEAETLNSRLEKLVNREAAMLFIKGAPSAEKCGFSRQNVTLLQEIVTLLKEKGVKFGFFDFLADEEVRQGLKTNPN